MQVCVVLYTIDDCDWKGADDMTVDTIIGVASSPENARKLINDFIDVTNKSMKDDNPQQGVEIEDHELLVHCPDDLDYGFTHETQDYVFSYSDYILDQTTSEMAEGRK